MAYANTLIEYENQLLVQLREYLLTLLPGIDHGISNKYLFGEFISMLHDMKKAMKNKINNIALKYTGNTSSEDPESQPLVPKKLTKNSKVLSIVRSWKEERLSEIEESYTNVRNKYVGFIDVYYFLFLAIGHHPYRILNRKRNHKHNRLESSVFKL